MRYVLTLLFVLGALLRKHLKVSAGFPENTNLTVYAFIQPVNRFNALSIYAAVKYLEANDLAKANIVFSLTYLTNGCNRRLPMRAIMDFVGQNRRVFDNIGGSIHGVVVDSCDKVCRDMAILGSIYHISVMTYGCMKGALNRELGYKTFVRSITSENFLPVLVHEFAHNRRWWRAVLFQKQVAEGGSTGRKENDQLSNKEEEEEGDVSIKVFSSPEAEPWVESIRKVKDMTRVLAINMESQLETIIILLAAKSLDLYNGEYVFITFDFHRNKRSTVINSAILDYDRAAVQEVVDELEYLQTGLLALNFRRGSPNVMKQLRVTLNAVAKNEDAIETYKFARMSSLDDINHAAYAFDAMMIWGKGVKHAAENTDPMYSKQELFGTSKKTIDSVLKIVSPPPFDSVTGRVIVDGEVGDCNVSYTLTMVQYSKELVVGEFERNLSAPIGNDEFNFYWIVNSSVKLVWPGGSLIQPVGYPVPCGWEDSICKSKTRKIIIGCVFGGLGLLCVGVVAIIIINSRYQALKNELMQIDAWTIKYEDLSFEPTEDNRNSSNTEPVDPLTISPTMTEENTAEKKEASPRPTGPRPTGPRDRDKTAVYRNVQVHLHHISKHSVHYTDSKILMEIKQMRNMNHDNIVMFIGVCVEAPHVSIVMAFASHGSLHHVMIEKSMDLSIEFTSAFLFDIAKGMTYLHSTDIGSHGNLSSLTCVIDHRWNCKITDYGLAHFRKLATKTVAEKVDDKPFLSRESKLVRKYPFWTAPELLRKPKRLRPLNGTKKGDVYSFAIIIQEVLINQIPFGIDLETLTPYEIIERVQAKKKPVFRPTMPVACCDVEWIQLMNDAWEEDPFQRPTFRAIGKRLKSMGGSVSDNMIEKLMTMLEMYATHLEELVEQRTRQTNAERERAAHLLYSLLPPIVADALQQGRQIPAENFKSVTMFVSDIVSFTKLSAASTPLQIVELLGQLYLEFDSIVDRHDAYKVETIGDAYVIASGLPIPSKTKHALEIADIALEALSFSFSFVIPHLPERPLQLRIGMHTGPVVTGVVGVKMPRYCLFGETVSIAAKMESNSAANHIHVSQTAAEIIKEANTYDLYSRGHLELKGAGSMETFFLLGKTGLNIPLPQFTPEQFPLTSAGH